MISGGYRLIELLASSPSAEVWRAEASHGLEVAVKIYHEPLASDHVQRQLAGLHLVKSLRHPALLPLHAFWSHEDRLMVAVQLAECGLQQWAAAARTTGTDLPVDELVRYIRGPAEALDYLRSRDIAHGAVNSGHTFLCAGRAILGSLGHARSLAGSGDSALNDLATTYAELRLGRPLNENQRGGADASSSVLGMPEWRQLGPKEQEAIRRGLAGRFDSCWEFARALQLAVA